MWLKFEIFSLEWLKLNNNKLRTLPYELVEPILDTVKHIDIHGKRLGIVCPKQWTPSTHPMGLGIPMSILKRNFEEKNHKPFIF